MKRICVFCGSNSGRGEKYRAMAVKLGHALVEHGLGLVYGGGKVGYPEARNGIISSNSER